MKTIINDTVISVVTDTESAAFPSSNLLDYHTKKIWKATLKTAQISTRVSSTTNTVALFNTNAQTATVTAKTGGGGSIRWSSANGNITTFSSSTIGFCSFSSGTNIYAQNPSGIGSLWCEYTSPGIIHTVEINLTSTSTAYAGVIRAGEKITFNEPQNEINEGLKDFSIVKELNNGSIYYFKKDINRTFNFSLIEETSDIHFFMLNIAQYKGPEPLPWKIWGASTDYEWITFARFAEMPKVQYINKNYAQLDVNLIEVF